MISFEEFEDLIDEIIQTFPEEFFRDLNGGVFARENVELHPEGRSNDLVIMGQYCVNQHLGRYIVIYYGSFTRVYGHLSAESFTEELRKVLLHEFRHHLESLAGLRDLEVEDAIQIARYKENEAKESTNT